MVARYSTWPAARCSRAAARCLQVTCPGPGPCKRRDEEYKKMYRHKTRHNHSTSKSTHYVPGLLRARVLRFIVYSRYVTVVLGVSRIAERLPVRPGVFAARRLLRPRIQVFGCSGECGHECLEPASGPFLVAAVATQHDRGSPTLGGTPSPQHDTAHTPMMLST